MSRRGAAFIVVLAGTGCLTAGQSMDPFEFGEGTAGPEDDGAATSGESGDATTTSTTGIDPPMTTSPDDESGGGSSGVDATPVCGNDMVEGDEMCDGTDVGDLSCTALGFSHGQIECYSNCLGYSTDGCHICGNGMLDGPETCDGGVPQGATCASAGKTDGTLSCNEATCMLDLSGCSLCGDDVVEGNESCDGDDLGGATCESIGFGGGSLACSAEDCSYDVSGCDGGSFLEDWESGAISGDWTFGGNANWSVTTASPIAGTWTAQSGLITHSQTSSLSIDMTFPSGGTIAFTHEESTESSFDFLRFYIDGVQQAQWSGTNAPATSTYNVAAGAHTFEWRYSKDGSVNSGADAVWIDDITADGGGPV